MNDHRSTLWDFSVALYSSPALEKICLQLQDEWRANVNIFLWCCWLEQQQTPLTAARLDAALIHLESWHQTVIEPLRHLRREIKQQFDMNDARVESSRRAVKTAELAAEHVEQDWLEALARDWLASPADVSPGHNPKVYLDYLGVPEDVGGRMLKDVLSAMDTPP